MNNLSQEFIEIRRKCQEDSTTDGEKPSCLATLEEDLCLLKNELQKEIAEVRRRNEEISEEISSEQ